MSIYKIKIFTSLDEGIITQWEKLWISAENANMHNSYQRFLACIHTYSIKNFEIHTCYKNEELVALFPMCIYRHFGIKITGSVSNNVLYNTSFLMKEYNQELFRYFFTHILEKGKVYITRIDSKAAGILKSLFPEILFSLMAGVPYLDIQNDPFRFLPASTQKKIKNILKKNLGKFKFKIHEDKLNEHLKIMFTIEQKSPKKLHSKDLFSKEKNRDYYKNLIAYCQKFVSIAILYYQGNPIAYSFNLKCRNTFYCGQTAYLKEHKMLMPGKMIAFYLLESLRKSSVKTVDFGAGLSSFKKEFTPNNYFLYDVYFSKNVFVMLWWKSINSIRRIKKIFVSEKFTKDREFLFKTL